MAERIKQAQAEVNAIRERERRKPADGFLAVEFEHGFVTMQIA